jgi:hypothetical protein
VTTLLISQRGVTESVTPGSADMITEVFDSNVRVHCSRPCRWSEDFGTSAQVLQEFFVTVVRKASVTLSSEEALEWIEQFAAFPLN